MPKRDRDRLMHPGNGVITHDGMTKREYAAIQAMAALLTTSDAGIVDVDAVIADSITLADRLFDALHGDGDR